MQISSVAEAVKEDEPDLEQVLIQLSHILSHRLRGLVTSIEGFADLLTDTLGTKEQRELALRILEGASRIERILSDLQVYCNRIEPVIISVRIERILSELLSALEKFDSDRIAVEVPISSAAVFSADPHLLQQALLILIQNALEAGNRTGKVKLVANIDENTATVRFEVWNEGMIDLENAATQVFMPFYTTKAQNLGIGLSIAHRISRAHAGKLYLSSNDRMFGTCFTLELPV